MIASQFLDFEAPTFCTKALHTNPSSQASLSCLCRICGAVTLWYFAHFPFSSTLFFPLFTFSARRGHGLQHPRFHLSKVYSLSRPARSPSGHPSSVTPAIRFCSSPTLTPLLCLGDANRPHSVWALFCSPSSTRTVLVLVVRFGGCITHQRHPHFSSLVVFLPRDWVPSSIASVRSLVRHRDYIPGLGFDAKSTVGW